MGRFQGALVSRWLTFTIAALGAPGFSAGCGGAAKAKPPSSPGAAAQGEPASAPGPFETSGAIPDLPDDQGPPELAEADLACSSSDPEARRLYQEGYAAAERGELQESERLYLAAIARDPDYCDAMDNLAVQYRRGGRVEEAIKLYERSVAIAPHNEMAWQNLGYAYQSVDRVGDAVRAYQQIIDMSPKNPEGWYGRGQTLLMAGRYGEAKQALTQAEQLYAAAGSPLRGDAQMLLGMVAGATADWGAARALLEAQYESAGRFADANLYLGEAYLQPSALDRDKARGYLERARALGGDVPAELWQRATAVAPAPKPPAKR